MSTRLVVALVLGLTCSGCASMSADLFPRRPKGPDLATVESLMCRGDEAQARVYLRDMGASRAQETEAIERARAACPTPQQGAK